MLLDAAFGALFVSLLPMGLQLLGASPALVVRGTAGVLLLVVASFALLGRRALADPALRGVLDPTAAWVLRVAMLLVAAAELATLFGLAGRAGAGLVYFGVVALLGYAAFGFVRLMFIRPSDE